MMGCPFKEWMLQHFQRRHEGLLRECWKLRGPPQQMQPTSADAGVASCLLVNAEPVFRRLRNDLLDVKILEVGMTQGGGFKMQKRSVKSAS